MSHIILYVFDQKCDYLFCAWSFLRSQVHIKIHWYFSSKKIMVTSIPGGHEIDTSLFLRIGANHHHIYIYTYVIYQIRCFGSKLWLSVLRFEFFTISKPYKIKWYFSSKKFMVSSTPPGHAINTILFLRIGATYHHIYIHMSYIILDVIDQKYDYLFCSVTFLRSPNHIKINWYFRSKKFMLSSIPRGMK